MRSEYLGACDEPQSKTTLLTARVANGNHTDKRSNPTEIVRADNQATGGGDGEQRGRGIATGTDENSPKCSQRWGSSGASSRGAISVRDFTFDLRDVQAVFSMQ